MWLLVLPAPVVVLGLGVDPAAAARHSHQNRRHHHAPVSCGGSARLAAGPQCVPTSGGDPPTNCTVMPDPVLIANPGTGASGTVEFTVACTGLVPGVPITISAQSLDALCGTHEIVFPPPPKGPPPPPPEQPRMVSFQEGEPPPPITASSSGNLAFAIDAGPVCIPGTFRIVVSETVPPGTSFFAVGRLA
jgi:hypothetical protein